MISTSRHVTQGIVDISRETWNLPEQTLEGASQVVEGDPYELRVVARRSGGWRIASVSVAEEDVAAGVSIRMVERERDFDREREDQGAEVELWPVRIDSAVSREVSWSIAFTQ